MTPILRHSFPVPVWASEGQDLVVEEDRRYAIHWAGPSTATAARRDEVALSARTDGGFDLAFGSSVGRSAVAFEVDGVWRSAPLVVRSRSEKLSDGLWSKMVEEIEEWLAGATLGAESVGHGGVGTIGVGSTFLAAALLPLVPPFLSALKAVLEQPRHRERELVLDEPLRRIQRADRSVVTWIGRHAEIAPWLDPWKGLGLRGPGPRIPFGRTEPSLDHPANRYVAWLAGRAAARLHYVAVLLTNVASTAADADGRAWANARATACGAAGNGIERLLSRSAFASLHPSPPADAALQVVLDDPAYARVHSLGRRLASPRFRIEDDSLPALVRPSYGIYEIWCLQAVFRGLRSALPGWSWRDHDLGAVLRFSGTGAGAGFDGTGPDGRGKVRIEFNATFPGWFNRGAAHRYSVSSERRPDIVITARGPRGRVAWVALDAKYRAGRQNLGDAFESAHIYRDALRDEDHGGRAVAALLLAPTRSADAGEWFDAAFREAQDVGIWELRPGTDLPNGMGSQLAALLGLATGTNVGFPPEGSLP